MIFSEASLLTHYLPVLFCHDQEPSIRSGVFFGVFGDSIFNISVKFAGFLKAKEAALERVTQVSAVFL